MKSLESLFPVSTESHNACTVCAKTLHMWLGVATRFDVWINRRIKDYEYTEGSDFVVIKNEHNDIKDFKVTTNMAKELGMLERSEKGREIRRYFLKCEEIALSELPRLQIELDTRDVMIQQLLTAKAKKTRKPSTYLVPEYQSDVLSGFPQEPTMVRKSIGDMREPQMSVMQANHIQKTIKGLQNKLSKTLKKIGLE